ncbi:uncharacterized protein [Lolium perenne]|uniref:uncharacterized protein n=1 Tax=Lolium perenne TaxID=4522 RepID=UPI003A99D381
MALVLRFVNSEGFIKEHFLDVIHVTDTVAGTLKQAICTVLADNNLSVQDIRGQGYDGLALVASSREVHEVHNFFQNAIQIINVVSASPKRTDQLLAKQAEDIEREIELGELDTGKVSNTKVLLGKLREDGWESLLKEVQAFCMKHEIEVPDLSRRYVDVRKSRNKHDNTTTLHHYKADVFYVAIDQQLFELNDRFGVQNTELLRLCASLDPRHDSFDMSKICTLAEKFYPADFSSQERVKLLHTQWWIDYCV